MLLWRWLMLCLAIVSFEAYSEGSRFFRRGGAQSYQRTGSAPRSNPQASVGQGTIRNNIYYAPNTFKTKLPPNYDIERSSSYRADSTIDHRSVDSSAQHRYGVTGDYQVTRRGEEIQSGTTTYNGGKSNYYRTEGNETLRQKIDAVEAEAARHNGAFAEYMHAVANWGNQVHAELVVARAAYRRGEVAASSEGYDLLNFQEDRLKKLMDAARGMGSLDPQARVATIDKIKGIMGEIYEKCRGLYLRGRISRSDWELMEAAYEDFIYRADYARSRQ